VLKLDKILASKARLERVLFLAAGDADLEDDARDGLAFSIQELAEAYGVDERGVETIRAILVDADARDMDYQRAHETGAVRVELP
jgi:thiamine monophosphate kinase